MNPNFWRIGELDQANWPEIRDQILQFEHDEPLGEARSYPGYPRWPLPAVRARLWPALDRTLAARRSQRSLGRELPSAKVLSRLLRFSHGQFASMGRGPTPSSGGLQALELYLAVFEAGWLPAGLYHYGRAEHALAQVGAEAVRNGWHDIVPSLRLVDGGSLLWIATGDILRLEKKYGPRSLRFLLLEAGHLMQNLCLLSASLGLATVPLGGFFEREIARALNLPTTDVVLYVGICGKPH